VPAVTLLIRSARVLVSLVTVLLVACKGDGGSGSSSPSAPAPPTSFSRIQSQLFEKSCAFSSCHAPNSSASTLVLTGPDVYAKLVGATPADFIARADGLKEVMPGKPDSSLLWHKLNAFIAGHHVHDYGAGMPSSATPLSVEQLDFVRQWIERGASATGDDVNPQLLLGTTRPDPAPYVALTPPANGFQLKVSPFTTKPAFEREIFVYRGVGNTSDIYVNRIQTQVRQGSHHFVLYSFNSTLPQFLVPARDQVRDIRNSDGTYNLLTVVPMEYHVFFAGAQTQTGDFTFPPGVALKLPAGSALDLNSHYVNSTQQEIVGEAEANLYTVPAAQVTSVANALFLNQTDLTIPAGRDTTIVKTFKFSTVTRVIMLTSHMHSRGQKFVIRISGGARNGEVVYSSTVWDHPDIITYATPIVLQPGEGLTSECTYRGDPNKVVRFGLTSDDAMDIVFGYWY
jgi:hypothetical protein